MTSRASSNRVRWRRRLIIDPTQYEYADTDGPPPLGTGWFKVQDAIPNSAANNIQEDTPCTVTTDDQSAGTRTTELSSVTDADGHLSDASSSGSPGRATRNSAAKQSEVAWAVIWALDFPVPVREALRRVLQEHARV